MDGGRCGDDVGLLGWLSWVVTLRWWAMVRWSGGRCVGLVGGRVCASRQIDVLVHLL